MILRKMILLLISLVYFCTLSVEAAATECRTGTFGCDDIKCIPDSWVCDGSPDCRDLTDENEVNCPNAGAVEECDEKEFRCASGACIVSAWRCDGDKDCLDGSDELPDICRPNCTEAEFQCHDGQCISNNLRCNGVDDCNDLSDEINCTLPSSNAFVCGNGVVIRNTNWICDGFPDCSDGSDEENCTSSNVKKEDLTCKENEFLCPNSYCIPLKLVCDGFRECINGEDEANCPARNCSSSEFTCEMGSCISLLGRCDGFNDCEDESDEVNCSTTTTVPVTSTQSPTTEEGSSCNKETHFECQDKKCIPNDQTCDGTPDCSHNEDESEELCGQNDCERNNGACSQKCIKKRQGYECACNDGFRLVNKYNCEDINECEERPGVCSQRCVNTDGGFHCSCLPGYLRDPANYTRCKAAEGEVSLLFSHSFDIRKLRLRDSDMVSVVEDTRSAIALDYVFNERQILWSDSKDKKIYRANLINTNERQVLASHEDVSADGLAVDWIHKNVYYTNGGKSSVLLLSWDGHWAKTLIQEDVGIPRAIVVSPHHSSIFWTDWGKEPKLERASLDGSNRRAIVSDSRYVRWPNGLTLDHSTERLYWCDGYLRTIFASNFDGSNVKAILYSALVLSHPFSISVFEDRLYWTDWSRIALFSANKFTGEEILNVSAGHLLEAPKVVHVFHQYRQPKGENICERNACDHFCLRNEEGEAFCSCADGFTLQNDGLSCGVGVSTISISPPNENDLSTTRTIESSPSESLFKIDTLVQRDIKIFGEEQHPSRIGTIFATIFAVAIASCAVIAVYVMWTKTSSRRSMVGRIRFHNPVYKNTTSSAFDDDDDGRGYTIAQEKLFSRGLIDQYTICPDIITDADDVPLAPKDNSENV